MAISPDGKSCVSGSNDKTAIIWSVSDWERIGTLEGHTAVVEDLVFSPDGSVLVTVSRDRTLRVWKLSY